MNKKLKNTDLKDALASAESELQSTLKRAETLREWIAVTKRLCAKNSKSAEAETQPIARFRRTKATGTIQHIVEILQVAGAPLHVDEIVKRLAANNHASTARNPKATIAVAMSRRTDKFRKTAPNTFGLASATLVEQSASMAS